MRTTIIVFLAILIPFSSSEIKAQKSRKSRKAQQPATEYKKIDFYDKYAYKTAIEMYEIADTLPFGEDAFLLVKETSRLINRGASIDDEEIWKNLQKLEPYRMHPTVQDEVRIWVEKGAKSISTQPATKQATLSSLQSVSKAYNSGEFDKAIQECRKILSEAPNHLDIRSNMALALMHVNRDLCAQIELEIIRELSNVHIPSMLNLTVVYERMNMRGEAEQMVFTLKRLSDKQKLDIPPVRYNAAWYQFQNGNTRYADTLRNRANR